MGTAFSVKPVACAIGAEIHGVDLSEPAHEAVDDGVREAFHKHLVLVFRDQTLSPTQHRDFAMGFFELEAHPFVQGLLCRSGWSTFRSPSRVILVVTSVDDCAIWLD